MPKHQEVYFKEGCFIEEWLNTPEHQDMSVARVRVEPNSETRLHSLSNTTERYIILSGDAIVTVGEQSWEVSNSDVVVIEADQAQKIHNKTSSDLIFLAICTPRFQIDCYQDLESDA